MDQDNEADGERVNPDPDDRTGTDQGDRARTDQGDDRTGVDHDDDPACCGPADERGGGDSGEDGCVDPANGSGGIDDGAVCTGEVPDCYCPLTGVIEVLGRKYAMQVVCAVGAHGTLRFSDLEAHLPDASTSTLSDRLDELAARDLLVRRQYDEIPPRVEYELTEDGRELQRRLEPLLAWATGRS